MFNTQIKEVFINLEYKLIVQWMKQVYSSSTHAVVLCVDCSKKKSEFYCFSCNVHYCLNCAFDIHNSLKSGKKHELKTLNISSGAIQSDKDLWED